MLVKVNLHLQINETPNYNWKRQTLAFHNFDINTVAVVKTQSSLEGISNSAAPQNNLHYWLWTGSLDSKDP